MTFARAMIAASAALMVLVSTSQILGGSGVAPLPGPVVPAVPPQLQRTPVLSAPPARISAEFAARQAFVLQTDAKHWQATRAALKRLAKEAAALKLELATARAELAALRKAAVAWRQRTEGDEAQGKSGHLPEHASRAAAAKTQSAPAARRVAAKARATVEGPAAAATHVAKTDRLAFERLAFAGSAPKSGDAIFQSASPGAPAQRSSSPDVTAPVTKTDKAGPKPLAAKPPTAKPPTAERLTAERLTAKPPAAMPLAAKRAASRLISPAAIARSAPLAAVTAAAKRAQSPAAATPPHPDASPTRAPVRVASVSPDAKASAPPETLAPKELAPKALPPKVLPPKVLLPKAVLPKAMPPKPPKTNSVAPQSTKPKPAPSAWRTIVASAPPPDRLDLPKRKPAPSARSAESLTWELQQELVRVGCDPGPIDGKWGRQTRQALIDFVARSKISIATGAPSQSAVDAVSSADGRVCPLSCSAGQQAVNGTCIAKRLPPKSRLQARPQPQPQPKVRRSSRQKTARSRRSPTQRPAKHWTETIWDE